MAGILFSGGIVTNNVARLGKNLGAFGTQRRETSRERERERRREWWEEQRKVKETGLAAVLRDRIEPNS